MSQQQQYEVQQQQQQHSDSGDGQRRDLNLVKWDDIKMVQTLIERCLNQFMTQSQVVATLVQQANIDPSFTCLVWQKLEEQNPEFFYTYGVRVTMRDQILSFNYLVERQLELMQQLNAARGGAHPGAPLALHPPQPLALPQQHMLGLHGDGGGGGGDSAQPPPPTDTQPHSGNSGSGGGGGAGGPSNGSPAQPPTTEPMTSAAAPPPAAAVAAPASGDAAQVRPGGGGGAPLGGGIAAEDLMKAPLMSPTVQSARAAAAARAADGTAF